MEDDYKRAGFEYEQALRIRREYHSKYFTALCLESFASPLTGKGEPERAAILLGASQALLDGMGIERQTADQNEINRVLDSLNKLIDEATFEKAWTEGEAMSPEQAIAFALGEEHM